MHREERHPNRRESSPGPVGLVGVPDEKMNLPEREDRDRVRRRRYQLEQSRIEYQKTPEVLAERLHAVAHPVDPLLSSLQLLPTLLESLEVARENPGLRWWARWHFSRAYLGGVLDLRWSLLDLIAERERMGEASHSIAWERLLVEFHSARLLVPGLMRLFGFGGANLARRWATSTSDSFRLASSA